MICRIFVDSFQTGRKFPTEIAGINFETRSFITLPIVIRDFHVHARICNNKS